jgi:uncharacterized membrane protein YbhN (UPF0104 family)
MLRILVSALLLGWFAWQTNWPKVGEIGERLRPELWLAAAAVLVVAQLLSAVRWRQLAVPLGFERSLPVMVGYYFIGMYFNLMLPTSVGGDVVRAWYLDGRSGRRMRAFITVFLDRLCGLWVLLALGCAGVLLSPLAVPGWISASVLTFAAGGMLSVALLPLLVRHRTRAPWKFRTALEALAALPSARALLWPILLSIGVQAANVVIVWLLGEAIGAPVPPSYYWILVPLVSLLTLLPSINGMGVREVSMALLLAPLGVASEDAGLLAFSWFAVAAAVSLLGGLVYLFGRFERPVIPKSSQDEAIAHGPVRGDSDQGRTGQSTAAA